MVLEEGGVGIKTYRTAQVAEMIGVHSNTVRLYEELGLIPKAERETNGYRVYTNEEFEDAYLWYTDEEDK